MTDYAEEKEILSTGNELEEALIAIRNKQAQKTAEKLARERELSKVSQVKGTILTLFPCKNKSSTPLTSALNELDFKKKQFWKALKN